MHVRDYVGFLSKVEIGMIFFSRFLARRSKGLIAEVCTLHPGGFHEYQTQSSLFLSSYSEYF